MNCYSRQPPCWNDNKRRSCNMHISLRQPYLKAITTKCFLAPSTNNHYLNKIKSKSYIIRNFHFVKKRKHRFYNHCSTTCSISLLSHFIYFYFFVTSLLNNNTLILISTMCLYNDYLLTTLHGQLACGNYM